MTVGPTLSTTSRTAVHTVQLRHGVTLDPITAVSARFADGTPPGWSLSKRGDGTLVVSSIDRFGTASPPTGLVVELTDPRVAAHLDLGALCVTLEQTPDECVIEIPLAAPTTDEVQATLVEVPAAPQRIRITVIDTDGAPVTGATVTVRSSSGATEPAPEVGGGVYETDPPRTFTKSFAVFKVLVDGVEVHQTGLVPDHQTIEITVVNP